MKIKPQMRNERNIGSRFTVALCIFFIWSLIQLIFPVQFISYNIVLLFNSLKVVAPACGLLIAGMLYFNRIKSNAVATPFILFSVYSFVYVTLCLFDGSVDIRRYAQPILFSLWTFCMFILTPVVFDSTKKLLIFTRWGTICIFSIVVYLSFKASSMGLMMGQVFGGSRMGGMRYSLLYLNPSYLGGVCFSVVCGAMLLFALSDSRIEKLFSIIFICISLGAMAAASSRTYILGSIVLFVFYMLKNRVLPLILIKISLFCFVVLVIFFLGKELCENNLYQQINFASSNRFELWVSSLQHMMTTGLEWKLLFGNGVVDIGWSQGIDLAEGRVEKYFTRFAIDNVYIEMFIMYGVVGCGLLMWGFYRLLEMGKLFGPMSIIKMSKRDRRLLSIATGSILGILVGAFFTSHLPSLGNTINSFTLPSAISVLYIFNNRFKEGIYKKADPYSCLSK